MKKSILVAVCSLAGVCASSAQAGVYTLTTYRFDSPTGDTHVARDLLFEKIRIRTDGYYSQFLGILLGAWGLDATSTSPGFYNFQIFTADASALSNGSRLQFSNSYGESIGRRYVFAVVVRAEQPVHVYNHVSKHGQRKLVRLHHIFGESPNRRREPLCVVQPRECFVGRLKR